MDQDIVPALLESIEKQFDVKAYNSAKLKKALQRLKDKQATHLDVNDFAIEVGEILADVFNANIKAEVLPGGKMHFNIANRVINPTLKKNHDLISNFAVEVQTELNHAAGLRMKGQAPQVNQDRIDGIINRISSEDDFNSIKWILNEPIVNFSQSIVDETIKANVEFHAKAGLKPTIIRRASGKCCKGCNEVVGSYIYPNVPKDVYRRHRFCKCTVDYNPGDGRKQNVWSKQWTDPDKAAKIEIRKTIGLKKKEKEPEPPSYNYIEPSSFSNYNEKYGKISDEDRELLYDKRNGYIDTSNSFRINKQLRGQGGLKSGPLSDNTVETLERIIAGNTLEENLLVDRWVKFDWLQSIAQRNGITDNSQFMEALNSGKIQFDEKGFVSTSLVSDKNVMLSRDVRMQIQVPKGSEVFVTDNVHESEMILNRNSRFKILEANTEIVNGKEVFHVLTELLKE